MKRKDLNSIKLSKPFMKGDLMIYSLLLLLVVALFFAFVIFPKNTVAKGFLVYKNDNTVLSYSFDTNTLIVSEDFKHLVEKSDTKNGFTLTVYTDKNHVGFNMLMVDTQSKSVKVIDSTCSLSKDCVSFPALTDKGLIYCSPHGLKISPLNFTPSDPSTGALGGANER